MSAASAMMTFFGLTVSLLILGAAALVVVYAFLGPRRREPEVSSRLPPKPLRQVAGTVLRQVSDADIEREIRNGRVFSAIQLYQEKTGADAGEAKAAITAWRDRLRAS